MKEYSVKVVVPTIYYVGVQATSKEEAQSIAEEQFQSEYMGYLEGSGNDCTDYCSTTFEAEDQ